MDLTEARLFELHGRLYATKEVLAQEYQKLAAQLQEAQAAQEKAKIAATNGQEKSEG